MALDPIGPALRVDDPDLRAFAPGNAALEGGGYVLAWTVERDQLGPNATDIVFQLFDASGAEVGLERTVNILFASDQSEPDVCALQGGGFLVTWRSFDIAGLSYDVKGQLFDATGAVVGGEFLTHSASSKAQVDPAITALPGGGFVVTWQDTFGSGDGDNVSEIKAQLFNAAGARIGSQFVVNSETYGFQWTPAVTALKGGGFVVVYDSDGDIRGQVFHDDGDEDGGEFRVNRSTTGEQMQPQVAALADGGFVVVWVQDLSSEPIGEGQVLAQRFNAEGERVGGTINVAAGIPADVERTPAVTALHDGGFVIGWTSGSEFDLVDTAWLQQFDADGQPIGTSAPVGTAEGADNNNLDLTTLANGDVLVSWDARPEDGDTEHVFTQLFRPAATNAQIPGLEIDGSFRADTLIGGAGDDEVRAAGGNDSVLGLGGDDQIEGGSGRDTLSGGDGDDTIGGGSGADRIEGGRGDDVLDGGTGRNVFVFRAGADPGERDVIEGFDDDDRIALLDGVTVVSVVDTADVTGDGDGDTVLTLSNGGRIVLSDFTDWDASFVV